MRIGNFWMDHCDAPVKGPQKRQNHGAVRYQPLRQREPIPAWTVKKAKGNTPAMPSMISMRNDGFIDAFPVHKILRNSMATSRSCSQSNLRASRCDLRVTSENTPQDIQRFLAW